MQKIIGLSAAVLTVVFAVCLMSVSSAAAQATGTIVKTAAGTIRGADSGGATSFKGIPYAAPPVGDLRWRAPQPVQNWSGTRDAQNFGADCMQKVSPGEPIKTTPSEDCLYVNVWRPSEIKPDQTLPVMVWIHGGGYVGGGSSIPFYDGTSFARDGIIVVSLNYRLGRLGFFAHPALIAAGEGANFNYGYQDQLAALAWVQRNIRAFGGNPREVTLVGESAGGASVLHLLTSTESDGLFNRVMIMSGGGRRAIASRKLSGGNRSMPSAAEIDRRFAESNGIKGANAEALRKLRRLPANKLVDDLTLDTLLKGALLGKTAFPGTPVVDGKIVTADPGDLLRQNRAARVPVIIGTTAVDLPVFLPPLINPFGYFGDDWTAARLAYNPKGGFTSIAARLSIGTDISMHEPARYVARRMTAMGNPVWLYRFTYTAESTRPKETGQAHAGELPFIFDTLQAKYGGKTTAKDRIAARQFHSYVANFIKNGDPNAAGLPLWPKFDPQQLKLMNFTLNDGPVFGDEPRPGVIFVERVADR